jgi:hypothetical protein
MVSGTVTDATGAKVTGATIRLAHPGAPSLQTTTDSNGRFEIRAEPGEYLLETTAPGFVTDKLPVRLSAAIQSTEHIALRLGQCCGSIAIDEIPIETLDASLAATLPLTPMPPYKQTSKKPHSLAK